MNPFLVKPSLQNWMPQHALSRFAGFLANSKTPWLKNYLIQYFLDRYPVDMSLAANENPFAYPSYNDFFTRALKPEVRPFSKDPKDFLCPTDGTISQLGTIQGQDLLQAKGRYFTILELLGGDKTEANHFIDGSFFTVYLAPHDYHRVHMPLTGTLTKMIYVPGKLFSVNRRTTAETPNLFAKNERVIAFFDTPFGKMAMVLVGAMIVGSIETIWAGTIAPSNQKSVVKTEYIQPMRVGHPIRIDRGEEMGRFKLGSTVIVLLEPNVITWNAALSAETPVLLKQTVGRIQV